MRVFCITISLKNEHLPLKNSFYLVTVQKQDAITIFPTPDAFHAQKLTFYNKTPVRKNVSFI
jgi:hypothetical protein